MTVEQSGEKEFQTKFEILTNKKKMVTIEANCSLFSSLRCKINLFFIILLFRVKKRSNCSEKRTNEVKKQGAQVYFKETLTA